MFCLNKLSPPEIRKCVREPVKKKKKKKWGKFPIGSDPPPPMTENVKNFQKKN